MMGGGNGEVMVGGMASFSRTAKDLELKPRNVHSPGALPLLRGKTAKARVVIFFFQLSSNCWAGEERQEDTKHYILIYQGATGFETAPQGMQLVSVSPSCVLFLLVCSRLPGFNQIRTTHNPVCDLHRKLWLWT